MLLQVQTLKRNNWNVVRLYALNFFNNPKREIKKIKDFLDKLTASAKPSPATFKKVYKLCKADVKDCTPEYILSGQNDTELLRTIKSVVAAEEPISHQFLIKRTLAQYGILKSGIKLDNKLTTLINLSGFLSAEIVGNRYYFRADKYSAFDRYRVEEGTQIRSSDTDFTPYDIISLVKGILLSRVSVYIDELIPAVLKELKVRSSERLITFISSCIDEGVRRGIFVKSISDKITLS